MKKKKLPAPSPNSRALAALAKRHGFAPIARKVECNEKTIRNISSGKHVPIMSLRLRMLEVFELPLQGWAASKGKSKERRESGEPPRSKKTESAVYVPPAPDVGLQTRFQLAAVALEGVLETLKGDRSARPKDVAAIANAVSRLYREREKLDGSGLSESAVLRSGAWIVLKKRFFNALVNVKPDEERQACAKELSDACKEVDDADDDTDAA